MIAILANFAGLFYLVTILVAILAALFLFWRAGRHEFIDSELLLDTVIVGALGGLITGRVWDFLVRYEEYQFSLGRLVFFNVFPGIDFYGVLLGFWIAGAIFLRGKKPGFLAIFDLASAPIAIAQAIVALGMFLKIFLEEAVFPPAGGLAPLYFAVGYFLIFWILKRLGKRKRHEGFFTCFYLVSISILEISLFWTAAGGVMFGPIPYKLILGFGLLVFALTVWYILGARSLPNDIKNTSAAVLLSLLRFRRTVASIEESGSFAKLIILSPYLLAKALFFILKFIGREIFAGFGDFLDALGVRKIR
ncbi:prolipoprotein diacylglyceryl transferase [Candidatus Curtissbacteria bacterium]|nr:prolipoprotein diacylglyceryl transferase [Candidatus Curtissbacteria bacterium]